jgi:hypothetical protein
MSDFESLVVSSASLDDFSEACFKVAEALPRETKIRLNRIVLYCVQRYGEEGAYKRLNNRSVSQIFAEYPAVELKDVLEPEDLKLIASGEVDGMRWELYDPPSPRTTDGECADEQS